MMLRNFPGRVKLIEKSDFLSVQNLDTGVTISHVDPKCIYYLPTELTKFNAAAIPLIMNVTEFSIPKGSTIRVILRGWNSTFESYEADYIRQLPDSFAQEGVVSR